MLFDLNQSLKSYAPYLAFKGGWWDMVLLGVLNEVKQITYNGKEAGTINPDLLIHDVLTLLVVVFALRSMYALQQYFPYGRRGRTLWYPVVESIGIFFAVNLLAKFSSIVDVFFIKDIVQAVALIGLLRVIMSISIFTQNLFNATFSNIAQKVRHR